MRVHVASWPNYFAPGWPPGMSETGVLTGRAIAYMAKCFVINACGTIDPEVVEDMIRSDRDREYFADPANLGGSTIIDPTGAVIAGPAGPGEQIIYADADLSQIVRTKLIHDLSGHYQRDDVFEFGVRASSEEVETGRPPRSVAESPPDPLPGRATPVPPDPATASGRTDAADERADRRPLSPAART
jgi:aliphatic nitrilase